MLSLFREYLDIFSFWDNSLCLYKVYAISYHATSLLTQPEREFSSYTIKGKSHQSPILYALSKCSFFTRFKTSPICSEASCKFVTRTWKKEPNQSTLVANTKQNSKGIKYNYAEPMQIWPRSIATKQIFHHDNAWKKLLQTEKKSSLVSIT